MSSTCFWDGVRDQRAVQATTVPMMCLLSASYMAPTPVGFAVPMEWTAWSLESATQGAQGPSSCLMWGCALVEITSFLWVSWPQFPHLSSGSIVPA